jgi:tripartite-type tricarboxylate transporter receptor subunit TctC
MNALTRRAAALLLFTLTASSFAQAPAGYPNRPVKLVVGYSPGGAVDLIARTLAQPIAASFGQPVLVENKAGAGTNIAMRALIESAPDGYTLMLAANALAANPSLYQPAPFDVARDITPIALVGRVPVVLAANPQAQIPDFATLLAKAKASPGTITYGSPGNGATPHLATELLESAAGIKLNHVPYKGGAQAMNDVVAGHIQLVAVNALEVLPHVRAGKLRVLGVFSNKRSALFPEVPTIAESGFAGFESSVWYGLIGPARMPEPLVTRLHQEVQRALATPELRERLSAAGGEVLPGSRAMFAELVASEKLRYERLIRAAQIKPD